jgi:hypothetical protein
MGVQMGEIVQIAKMQTAHAGSAYSEKGFIFPMLFHLCWYPRTVTKVKK